MPRSSEGWPKPGDGPRWLTGPYCRLLVSVELDEDGDTITHAVIYPPDGCR